MEIIATSFINALKFALAAAGGDEKRRPHLEYIELGRNVIRGTNGRSAAFIDTDWDFGDQILLPTRQVADLVKVLKPRKGGAQLLGVTVLDGVLSVTLGATTSTVRIATDPAFPHMPRVYPAWVNDTRDTGAPVFGVHGKYMVDAYRACAHLGNSIRVHTHSETAPVVLEPVLQPAQLGVTRALFLVMPTRV